MRAPAVAVPGDAALPSPRGLAVSRFDVDDDAFALLEWPSSASPTPVVLPSALRDVLDLVLAGHSNAEIAHRRGRSPRTVANQVAEIFRRLGVQSRLELLATLGRSTRATDP